MNLNDVSEYDETSEADGVLSLRTEEIVLSWNAKSSDYLGESNMGILFLKTAVTLLRLLLDNNELN